MLNSQIGIGISKWRIHTHTCMQAHMHTYHICPHTPAQTHTYTYTYAYAYAYA